MKLKEFVEYRFGAALNQVIFMKIGDNIDFLSTHEKTLVFKYSLDAYEDLNESLRAGKESEFELYLNYVLEKLPNVKDVVYRGCVLSKAQIERYIKWRLTKRNCLWNLVLHQQANQGR